MNAPKRRFGGLKGQVQIADWLDGIDGLDGPDQVAIPLDSAEAQEAIRQAREKRPWLDNIKPSDEMRRDARPTMTVSDLIAMLNTLPPDARVIVQGYESGFNDATGAVVQPIVVNGNHRPPSRSGWFNQYSGRLRRRSRGTGRHSF